MVQGSGVSSALLTSAATSPSSTSVRAGWRCPRSRARPPAVALAAIRSAVDTTCLRFRSRATTDSTSPLAAFSSPSCQTRW